MVITIFFYLEQGYSHCSSLGLFRCLLLACNIYTGTFIVIKLRKEVYDFSDFF